jgi:hypothetical protein
LASRFCSGASAQRTLSPVRNIAVYNLAGSIRVQGGSGSEIVVSMTKRGADAGKLTAETGRCAVTTPSASSIRRIGSFIAMGDRAGIGRKST